MQLDSPEKRAAVFARSCPRRVSITAHGLKSLPQRCPAPDLSPSAPRVLPSILPFLRNLENGRVKRGGKDAS